MSDARKFAPCVHAVNWRARPRRGVGRPGELAMAALPRALGGCGTLAGSTAHRSRSTQYHSPREQPAVASGFVKPHHRQLRLRSPVTPLRLATQASRRCPRPSRHHTKGFTPSRSRSCGAPQPPTAQPPRGHCIHCQCGSRHHRHRRLVEHDAGPFKKSAPRTAT